VKCAGRLAIAFPDGRAAGIAREALKPDDGIHLRSSVRGATLELEAEADSAMGLLRTFDDALACLRATGVE
jgi:hypothetical protein